MPKDGKSATREAVHGCIQRRSDVCCPAVPKSKMEIPARMVGTKLYGSLGEAAGHGVCAPLRYPTRRKSRLPVALSAS